MTTESALTGVPGEIRMRCTLPSVVAGMSMVSSGTSVPRPRTSSTIGPRFTTSIQTVDRSIPGAAGFKCARPMVIARMAASTTTPIEIRRISLFLAASLRGMSISMSGDDGARRMPIRARLNIMTFQKIKGIATRCDCPVMGHPVPPWDGPESAPKPTRPNLEMVADGIRDHQEEQKAHRGVRQSQKVKIPVPPVDARRAITRRVGHHHQKPVGKVNPAEKRRRNQGRPPAPQHRIEPVQKITVQDVLLEHSPRHICDP